MNKYKVGQKVKVKENIESCSRSSHDIFFAREMGAFTGKIVTIKKIEVFGLDYQYCIEEDSDEYIWDEEWFEPVDEVKNRKDLKDGDIITLANGDRLMYLDGEFKDLSVKHSNSILDIYDLNEDLTYAYDSDKEINKVVKVERPASYYEVFNKDKEVKELTVEEISKLLGYEVKIKSTD